MKPSCRAAMTSRSCWTYQTAAHLKDRFPSMFGTWESGTADSSDFLFIPTSKTVTFPAGSVSSPSDLDHDQG